MAVIPLNIPDILLPRCVNGVCKENNLPVTNANARKALNDYIKRCVISIETKDAEALAVKAVMDDVTNNFDLT